MKNGNGLTAKECVEAVPGSRGFVTQIAKRLGVTRCYVYQLQKKYSTFADAIKEEREGNKDFAEGKLMELIDDGNVTAIIFYLKTQGKDRGYIERQQIDLRNVDMSTLTTDQLERIAAGEDVYHVIATTG